MAAALRSGTERVRGRWEAFADGITVLTNAMTAFQPYAVVRCGAPLPWDTTLVSDPVVIMEVVHSHFARGYDTMGKMAGYFDLPSVQHYLIVDGSRRSVTHFRRRIDDFEGRFHSTGPLRLDPPGLDLAVENLLGPLEDSG